MFRSEDKKHSIINNLQLYQDNQVVVAYTENKIPNSINIDIHSFEEEEQQLQLQQQEKLKFHDQEKNGVSGKLKFIVFQNFLASPYLNMFKQIRQQYHVQYYMAKYQINEFIGQGQEMAQLLQQEMNNFQLLIYQCENDADKYAIKSYLQDNIDQLLNEYKPQTLLIKDDNDIIQGPFELRNQIQNILFVILVNAKSNDIQMNQHFLNKTIQTNLKSINYIFQIDTKYKPYFNLISLQQQYQFILFQVGDPQFDVDQIRYYTQVQVKSYLEINNEQLQEIKDKLIQLLTQFTNKQYIFYDIKKFKLIEQIVKQYQSQDCEFKIIQNKIRILGNSQLVQSAFQQITQFIKPDNLLIQTNKVKVPPYVSSKLAKVQQSAILDSLLLGFSKLFQKQAYIIPTQFSNYGLELTYYYCSQSKQQMSNIATSINTIIGRLHCIELSVQQYQFIFRTAEQLLGQDGIFVIKDHNQYILCAQESTLEAIGNESLTNSKYQFLKYTSNNDYLNKQLFRDLWQEKIKIQDQPIRCEKLILESNKILLSCKNTQGVEAALNQYCKQIKFVEIPIDITIVEVKYIKHFKKQALQDLQDHFQCDIVFQEKPQQKESTNHTHSLMRFKDKEVKIVSVKQCDCLITAFDNFAGIDYKTVLKIPKLSGKNFQWLFANLHRREIHNIGILYTEISNCLIEIIDEFMKQSKTSELLIIVNKPNEKDEVEQQVLSQMNDKLAQESVTQWQWKEIDQYVDYDDEYMNNQIEEGYQEYLKDNKKNSMDLKFPCSYIPGTHQVDIDRMQVQDFANGRTLKLSKQDDFFFLDKQQIDDSLNQYLHLQIQQGLKQFQVFIKSYTIIFDNNQFFQINKQTGFRRLLRRIQKDPIQSKTLNEWIKQKNQLLQTAQPGLCVVRADNEQIVGEVQKQLQKLVKVEQFKILLPTVSDQQFFGVMNAISKYSIEIQGDICPNSLVSITSINVYKQQILDILQSQEFISEIPIQQTINLTTLLHELQKDSQDYQQICKEFGFLKIKKLHKIMNYNYQKYYLEQVQETDQEVNLLYGNNTNSLIKIMFSLRNGFPLNHNYINLIGPFGAKQQYLFENKSQQVLLCKVLLDKHNKTYKSNSSSNEFYLSQSKVYPKYFIELEQ